MLIFYEFLYCVVESFVDMCVVFGGDCEVVLVCELIKLFEMVIGELFDDLMVCVVVDFD